MFEELFSSMGDLKEADRLRLASFLEKRNELMLQMLTLNSLQAKQLRDPSPENELRVSSFSNSVVKPLQRSIEQERTDLVKSAVDIEGLKGLLPMILAGLTQYVNLALVLNLFDTNPDDVQRLIKYIKDYIQSD